MLKLLVAKIIGSVEVSCGKIKVFFEGWSHIFNLGKFRFCDLLCSRLNRNFVFTELDLMDIRSISNLYIR